MSTMTRRLFLTSPSVLLLPDLLQAEGFAAESHNAGSAFPSQDPDVVREMVTVSHGNVARVKELVGRQPALARAAWDWGFGDWEDALGAASHVGNREIAEFLIEQGARPTIFSAAMLGQLDTVKAFITALPGVQRTKGPHGIPLLSHAGAGGPRARAVVDYLNSVGGADEKPRLQPLATEEMEKLAGTYEYGAGSDQRMEVAVSKQQLTIKRQGRTERFLFHVGSLEFYPTGAEAVRIAFAESAGAMVMTIRDPEVVLVARCLKSL